MKAKSFKTELFKVTFGLREGVKTVNISHLKNKSYKEVQNILDLTREVEALTSIMFALTPEEAGKILLWGAKLFLKD